MTGLELRALPTGNRGWTAFIDDVASSDDRIERHFLEVKSHIDLTSKQGRHKVAKFILGAANRNPDTAERALGGYAVMVLGVAPGEVLGISGFEVHELTREVEKFTGHSGPGWDHQWIQYPDDRHVLVIIVDPPTGGIWPCLSDGNGLNDGDLYVRADGETRKATGVEAAAMIARGSKTRANLSIEVTALGHVHANVVDTETLMVAVERETRSLLSAAPNLPSTGPLAGYAHAIAASSITERRSVTEFRAQVDSWRDQMVEHPLAGVAALVAAVNPGFAIRIQNLTRNFHTNVRIDLFLEPTLAQSETATQAPASTATEVDGQIHAVHWRAEEDASEDDLLPGRPHRWGRDSYLGFIDGGRHQPALQLGSKWSPAEWCTTDLSERVPAT